MNTCGEFMCTYSQVRDSKGALSLSKLFRVGQLLPFSVLEEVRTKNLVALTVNPRIVNSNLSASDIRPNMVSDMVCL